jgi:outer membrane protein
MLKTNKYLSLIALALFAIVHPSLAQTGTAFTLQEALNYAYTHSSALANAKLEEKITNYKIKEFKGVGLPQVKASADIKYFPNVPTQVLPNFIAPATVGAIGGLVQSGALSPSVVQNPAILAAMANPDNYEPIAAQFGTKVSNSLGVNASWLIADASFFLALKAQREVTTLLSFNTERTKIDIAEQVSKAYYISLVSAKRAGLLQISIDNLTAMHTNTKALQKEGFVEKIDVSRLEVAIANLQSEQLKVLELVNLTKDVLKFQMGYDVASPIQLTDTISDNTAQLINTLHPFSADDRIEISMLKKNIELTRMQLRARELAWIPNLLAIGSYSVSHFSNSLDFYKQNAQYFPTSLVGLSINATLFDGMQNKYKMQQIKLQMTQAANSLATTKQGIILENENAKTTFKNALISIESNKKVMALASEIFNTTQIKYKEGVGSNLEVLTADKALKESQNNYFTALYDAYLAKITLEKSYGTLIKN